MVRVTYEPIGGILSEAHLNLVKPKLSPELFESFAEGKYQLFIKQGGSDQLWKDSCNAVEQLYPWLIGSSLPAWFDAVDELYSKLSCSKFGTSERGGLNE